jgi:hypothetical protein
MNDTFIITVLSFALVLAVVASLFVWVILPALEEEGIVQGNNSIQELQDDVEEKVNSINRKAYQYDLDQQAVIDRNKADILQLKTRLDSHVAATGGGSHVVSSGTVVPPSSSLTTTPHNSSIATQGQAQGQVRTFESVNASPQNSSYSLQNALNTQTGVSAANQATVSFTDGTWTIQQGDVSYKANQTHICGSPGNCISRNK